MLRKKLFGVSSQQKDTMEKDMSTTGILDLSLQNCNPTEVSRYFPNALQAENSIVLRMIKIQNELNSILEKINFLVKPVKYVYNPTIYATSPNLDYIRMYCQDTKRIVLVGMNPGPFGMCQTGVPFGDVNWVKNWLRIEGPVHKPPVECPERPILGFNCTRKEQSGDRFWKFWAETSGTPEKFFQYAYVYNYCPLAFMAEKGRNLTPADIKDRDFKKVIETACDKPYLEVIRLLQPKIIIAIGGYTENRTKDIFKRHNIDDILLIRMPHPSPRSVKNQNWPEKARNFLEEHNLLGYFV